MHVLIEPKRNCRKLVDRSIELNVSICLGLQFYATDHINFEQTYKTHNLPAIAQENKLDGLQKLWTGQFSESQK